MPEEGTHRRPGSRHSPLSAAGEKSKDDQGVGGAEVNGFVSVQPSRFSVSKAVGWLHSPVLFSSLKKSW